MRLSRHARARLLERCPFASPGGSIPIPRRYALRMIGTSSKRRAKQARREIRSRRRRRADIHGNPPDAPNRERNRRSRYRMSAEGLFVVSRRTVITVYPVPLEELAGLLCWLMLGVWA